MRRLLLSLMLLLSGALASAQAQSLSGLTEGVEYRQIAEGKPYRPGPGKIEVAEIFAYWCPHCAHFDPLLEKWRQGLPRNTRFVAIPMVSGPDDAWAKAFFAAEAAKALPVVHPRLFRAVHETSQLPREPSLEQVNAFVARVPGINQKAYLAALQDSAAMEARLAHAYRFAVRSDIPGTPALVIDGRYLVLGNSYQALLDNAGKVIRALTPAAVPAAKPAAKRGD